MGRRRRLHRAELANHFCGTGGKRVGLGLTVAMLAWLGVAPAVARGEVAVYLTTADLKITLARQPDVTFGPGAPAASDLITVNPALTYQTLTAGFGVAMTDTSAFLLAKRLSAAMRDRAMRQLFSSEDGIGLSFLRVPIAGSDYVVGAPYTYDDMPPGQADPTLTQFSIAHDLPYIFPMIRQALALNPRMTVMANPWSPPAWMKADDKLVSVGPDGTLLPQNYSAYAQYLIKSVQAYGAARIPVTYLGVQNEPYTPLLLVSGIPNSYLSGVDEGNLIHTYVAPALRQAGLDSKIIAYDDGYQRSESFIPAAMGIAGPDISALAYHCYLSDPSSMTTEHMLYPKQPALETECSSYLSNLEPAQMTIRALRNWAQGVQLWNAALDQSFGPKIGNGCMGDTPPHQFQQCIAPLTINTTTHTYSLTSDYWALAHFSKFIQLGAKRIESSSPSNCPDSPAGGYDCGLEDVAFRNPDGTQVVVATAHDGRPHTAIVSEGGQSFSYTVPDGATVTFVWPAPVPASTGSGASPTTGSIVLPRSLECRGPQRLTVRLPTPATDPLRRAVIRLNGRRLRVLRRPHRRVVIDLRALPRRRSFRVTVVVRTRNGRTIRTSHTYPACRQQGRGKARRRHRRTHALVS